MGTKIRNVDPDSYELEELEEETREEKLTQNKKKKKPKDWKRG